MTVSESPSAWAVNFTVIDATGLHDNIQFKGDMTDWQTVPMIPDENTWTLSLQVEPGSYEWGGAIEGDGSPDGIWLIEGPNLLVNISDEGVITGDTLYTTLVTFVDEQTGTKVQIYPNPVSEQLNIKGLSADAEFMILNLNGKILHSGSLTNRQSISVSALPKGLYILELRSTSGIYHQQFLKQ